MILVRAPMRNSIVLRIPVLQYYYCIATTLQFAILRGDIALIAIY
jgi:hypothetical protein